MTRVEIERRGTKAKELLEAEASDPATPLPRMVEIWAAVHAAGHAPITSEEALAVLERAVRRPS
jgi:hypothetical protein